MVQRNVPKTILLISTTIIKIISYTNTYKYLGIILDQSLSLNDHFTSTYKKAATRLYLLNRVRPNIILGGSHYTLQNHADPTVHLLFDLNYEH